MILRNYQASAVDLALDHFAAGDTRVLLVAPTGAGKTVIFCAAIQAYLQCSEEPVIVIVHRRELVDQALEKLVAHGVRCSVFMGSDARFRAHERVQVCGISTLERRIKDGKYVPSAGFIIHDEAHHSLSPQSQRVLKHFKDAWLLGVTATPWRIDGFGFRDLYSQLVVASTPAKLIEQGSLVPFHIQSFAHPDVKDLLMRGADFAPEDVDRLFCTATEIDFIVAKYREHAAGEPAIVFPASCKMSSAVVEAFQAAGYSARHIDWSTPAKERKNTLAAFKRGELTILSSVGVLTEGFDAPNARVCILARPTMSKGLHIQMIGRVLRPYPGKTSALIQDHASNLLRHGLPDEEHEYSLDYTPQVIVDRHTCTECLTVVSRWTPDGRCPQCGSLQHVPKEPKEDAGGGKREDKATLEAPIMLTGEDILAVRATVSAGPQREIPVDEPTPVRNLRAKLKAIIGSLADERTREELEIIINATREQKAAEWKRLAKIREERNFQPGFIGHNYRAIFGVWPQFRGEELKDVPAATQPLVRILREHR